MSPGIFCTIRSARHNGTGIVRGLGWFSIGLGLAEVFAPDKVARLAGIPRNSTLVRAMGLREIAAGVLVLARRRPVAGMWSRLAGDVMDLGLLGAAARSRNSDPERIAVAVAAVAGVTALDAVCAQRVTRDNGWGETGSIHVEKSVTISREPREVYEFWHDFENLPRFMSHLHSVTRTGDGRSHWIVKAPGRTSVEWDAEIVEDRANELISWRSLEGADVENSGVVQFERAPGERGTIVRVALDYCPPGGRFGAGIARLLGEAPEKQVPVDLLRFKQLMETGEIIRTEGQPAARARSTSLFDEFVRG